MDVDLHIHSTASDGSYSPHGIVDRARSLNLKAIAITDHDTVDGAKEIMTPEATQGLHVLSGVEISSYPPDGFDISGNFHILGYGMRLCDPDLDNALIRVRQSRNKRNPRIIQRLNDLGISITYDEVVSSADGKVIGRPHIARVLVQKGYVSSIREAFDRYLAQGRSCFVEKFKMDSRESFSVIRQAGGLPFLAHPGSLGIGINTLKDLLISLKKEGLAGVEAYYTEHSPELTKAYCDLADELNLLITGGSDFHGSYKKGIDMGSGKGQLSVPFSVYDRLAHHLRNTH